MNPMNLNGIVTVLNTPFNEENSIDIPSLKSNIDYALESGVKGFLLPAMAGEVHLLTEKERETLVSSALDHITGRLPVIGGASADSREKRAAAARKLLSLGCDGILVSVPFQDERSYKQEVHEILSLDPGFLMLQDWDAQGNGVPIDVLVSLFEEAGTPLCVKIEVVHAGLKYSRLIAATGGKMHISGGWAVTQMIEGLDRGVHTFMPTGMHEVYTEIYRRYESGDRDAARRLFYRLLPILAFSNQHLDVSICFFKRLLWRQGIYKTPFTRIQSGCFDRIHEFTADELIDYYFFIKNSLTGE